MVPLQCMVVVHFACFAPAGKKVHFPNRSGCCLKLYSTPAALCSIIQATTGNKSAPSPSLNAKLRGYQVVNNMASKLLISMRTSGTLLVCQGTHRYCGLTFPRWKAKVNATSCRYISSILDGKYLYVVIT